MAEPSVKDRVYLFITGDFVNETDVGKHLDDETRTSIIEETKARINKDPMRLFDGDERRRIEKEIIIKIESKHNRCFNKDKIIRYFIEKTIRMKKEEIRLIFEEDTFRTIEEEMIRRIQEKMIRRIEEQMIRSLIIMMIVLQALFCSKVKLKVVPIFRLYKVIKLVLWTCGDIEKNPGPTSPGFAKIAAMRELTPILYKIINGLKPESKAPNGFYKDDEYKPRGFKMEMLDPNNCKTLAKTKQLEELFFALVEYCDENAFPIPDRYRDEIQALQANDFASLENRRSFRHFEEDLNGFVQKAIDNGPEAINQTLKILKEKEHFLRSKKCDDTATENQQKRNKPVASTSFFNPNQHTSIADSDCTDSTQDCVSGMCYSDQSPNTSGKSDAFCANDQNENKHKSDDLKTASNNDISHEQHKMTVSAPEDNQPKANDILCQKRNETVVLTTNSNTNQRSASACSHYAVLTQACSTSEQGTDDYQNATINSDEFLLSTDQLQTIESIITESTGLSVDTWTKQLNLQ